MNPKDFQAIRHALSHIEYALPGLSDAHKALTRIDRKAKTLAEWAVPRECADTDWRNGYEAARAWVCMQLRGGAVQHAEDETVAFDEMGEPYVVPAQQAQPTECPNGDACKHGSWCTETYCQEHCQFKQAQAEAMPQRPDFHDEWSGYLKDGETPFERFLRERKDLDALMKLYQRTLEENEQLKAQQAQPTEPTQASPEDMAVYKAIAEGYHKDKQAQTEAFPKWLTYDPATDVLTIHGKRYSAGMFGEEGFLAPVGTLLRVEAGAPDVVTLTKLWQPSPPICPTCDDVGFCIKPSECAKEIERMQGGDL